MVIVGTRRRKEEDEMISWIWLIPALMAGAMFGVFAIALVNGGRKDE